MIAPEFNTIPLQSWVAKMAWPGRAPFYFGTFYVRRQDGIEAARRKAQELAFASMAEILPEDTEPPEVLELRPGALLLVNQGEFDE